MNAKRAMAALLVTVAVTFAIGYGSRAAYTPPGAEGALLRLSWRLRGEKQQTCRDRTKEELAALPAHMRMPQVCTDRLLAYRLVVRIDDETPDTVVFAPAGAKGDRPIFVLHDRPLLPGDHAVRIDFTPVNDQQTIGPERRLSFAGRVSARRGNIALVTLAPDQSKLEVHSAAR